MPNPPFGNLGDFVPFSTRVFCFIDKLAFINNTHTFQPKCPQCGNPMNEGLDSASGLDKANVPVPLPAPVPSPVVTPPV